MEWISSYLRCGCSDVIFISIHQKHLQGKKFSSTQVINFVHQIPFWIIYRNITWTAQTLYIFRHLASIAYSSYLLNPWSKAENVNLHEYMNMMSIQLFMNKKMTALTLYYMYIWHSLFRFTLVYTILNIYIWMHHSNMQSAADYIIIGMFNACHNRNMD